MVPPDSSSQMDSMPPDFESQFQEDCNIGETQADTDMSDARQPPRRTLPLCTPLTLDKNYGVEDDGDGPQDKTSGSAEKPTSQINIFPPGVSLFGGDDSGQSIPESLRSSQVNDADREMSLLKPSPCSASSQANHTGTSPRPDKRDHNDGRNDFPPNPFVDAVLDPSLGTQVPTSESPRDYYGSAEDNEHSRSPTRSPGPNPSRRSHNQCKRNPRRSETPDAETAPPKYEFRERDGHVITSHFDWDESGNYDPADERRRTRKAEPERSEGRKRRSGQIVEQDDLDENGQPRLKKLKSVSLHHARLTGARCVVSISLKSEAGRDLLSRYQGQDNWPDDSYNFFSDKHIAETLLDNDGDESDEPGCSGRKKKLRPRKYHVRYNSPLSDDDLPPIPDPLGLEDDLRHHPAARGCVKCRIEERKCSLRETGNTWPCLECIHSCGDEDVVQCELISPPGRKVPCENCLDSEKDCSYNDPDTDHNLACRQCQEESLTCMAGPDEDALPKRITYTPPPGVEYVPYRPFVACTACRKARKGCSLKKKTDQPPCRACQKADIPCTFEKLYPINPGKQKVTAIDDSPVASSSPSGLVRDEEPANNGPSKKRDSGIAGMTPMNKKQQAGPSTAPKVNADGITTFRTGANTASAHRNHTLPRAANKPRMDRIVHINPHSTLIGPRSLTIQSYHPTNPNTPASYHLPPPPADLLEMTDSAGHTGHFREMVTALAHPVTFSLAASSRTCRFCADPTFGLVGLSFKKASVIAWADGRGCTEVLDGHRGHGAAPAAMCRACVLARVDVLACPAHELASLFPPGASRAEVDAAVAAQAARFGERGGGGEGDREGWDAVGGDLQVLLEQKLATEGGVVECRADAAFLLEQGMLMKNVEADLSGL
ncbi:hypothetical protein SLS56_003558 [Neofusicoccum ribis]|uniref:Zn(2)-C6 fungal-type domain-containing protein n=1 Tax=Neofusicoccum ribis TaxID=45134 RepID=A0ABR3SYS2_9PEZI